MCGRFTQTSPSTALAQLFLLSDLPPIAPRYNLAPSQGALVIRQPEPNQPRQATFMQWGLIPSWAKDHKIGYKTINARSETAPQKPAFRAAFKRRRCLVPMDGFYEWQKTAEGKQPMFIHHRNGRLLAAAGLWEHWMNPEGSELETFTILTTAANKTMEPLHHRMPVFLEPETFEAWLDPLHPRPKDLTSLMKACPEDWLTYHPVSQAVNRPGYDNAKLLEPLAVEKTEQKEQPKNQTQKRKTASAQSPDDSNPQQLELF